MQQRLAAIGAALTFITAGVAVSAAVVLVTLGPAHAAAIECRASASGLGEGIG